MRIGIAFDLAPIGDAWEGPDDQFEEFDKPETVDAIAAALRARGHEVVLLGDGREFIARLLETSLDLVWNIAEGEGVGRCREARVPAVCEMLGVPCTGSDPLTLAASLDKNVAKRLVAGYVATPWSLLVEPGEASKYDALVERVQTSAAPWIVKPAFEGSSKGIRSNALVRTPELAVQRAQELAETYRQPILIEEYIRGDEVTVGLIGNGADVEILGMMRVVPRLSNEDFVYSIELKRDWSEHISYETPARLSPIAKERVAIAARSAFAALGCRDVARIDFRVRDEIPYFLEANPLPGLAPDWSDLVLLAKGVGVSHSDLIDRILNAALARIALSEDDAE